MNMSIAFGRPRYDAVIVGARCAGAATAMLLARAGLRVLVLDRKPQGSDTLSTHALMRGAVVQLARWGLLPAVKAAGTPRITETTFRYRDEEIVVPIKPDGDADGLYAPRRTVLDPILVDAARAAGADIRHDTAVTALCRDAAGRVAGVVARGPDGMIRTYHADLVIGADGVGSFVARSVEAGYRRRSKHAAAVLYAYVPNPGYEGYHWHYGPAASAGVIPTNGGMACCFASAPTARFDEELRGDLVGGFMRVLGEVSPDVAHWVARSDFESHVRGFRGVPGFIREAHGPGWALVGDAGFFRDPATAHGITDALRDAEALASAVIRGGKGALDRYAAARDAAADPVYDVTEAIAACDWSLDELKEHHKRLSTLMKNEALALRAADAVPA